ncbi:protein trichome birefringence-like 12 isoform X2 [Amborella trichopoda]|uniref:protein trichome birefringence-like 12 isoform X2 n=1 Tax=Amborella trichopoda TaxID=13333 RepID=UPI0009BF2BAB|nr:protein trichome birefringence-like 12 isoform X2 [Amborella trichopoda]|eukprot:XP_020527299.1 protein trichome birefringence-like 12 isoform X2 [Amborella trichopoda]
MNLGPFPSLTKRPLLHSLPYFTFLSLLLITCFFLYLYTNVLPFYTPPSLEPLTPRTSRGSCRASQETDNLPYFNGKWIEDPQKKPFYGEECPFHRNAWNCLKNKRENMEKINSWRWVPDSCALPTIDPFGFLGLMRNKRIGFVGDSLNENFLVSFLCILRIADETARKWKRNGAWRGGYFPKFNATVAYHRAVLLAKYQWGIDKFPKETPLVFYKNGKAINPPLGILDGLKVVLNNMISYIDREVPKEKLKFWRTQSPRHFHGGDWNENGTCLFENPLNNNQLDIWFDPRKRGVNKEARLMNSIVKHALLGSSIHLLDLAHLSEFRADAHPAIWLGKKDAVAVWGQDCMHWCLPGVPDTWVDILSTLIHERLVKKTGPAI